MRSYRIFTDASTSVEDGISGIACVMVNKRKGIIKRISTINAETDNNTAELTAVLFALRIAHKFDEEAKYLIMTDSQYAIDAIKHGTERPHEKRIVADIKYLMRYKNFRISWYKGHDRETKNWASRLAFDADYEANVARMDFMAQLEMPQKPSRLNGYANNRRVVVRRRNDKSDKRHEGVTLSVNQRPCGSSRKPNNKVQINKQVFGMPRGR